MKLTLVTGSSGLVGRALVAELRRRDYSVRCVVRLRTPQDKHADVIEVGELSSSTDWVAALRGVDTVFHLAARVHITGETDAAGAAAFQRVNVDATAALARAASAVGVSRLIYASSVKVMGEVSSERPFDENDLPQPQDAYGHSKLAAERELTLLADRIAVTIVRPPLVYGPGVRANFLSLLKLSATHWPLPLGAAPAKRSIVFIDNLVDALITCATVPHGSPATYFVSDGSDVSVAELVATLRSALGVPASLVAVPPTLLRVAARAIGRAEVAQRLLSPLQVNTGRITRDLGWKPPVSMEQGLLITARWFSQARAKGLV